MRMFSPTEAVRFTTVWVGGSSRLGVTAPVGSKIEMLLSFYSAITVEIRLNIYCISAILGRFNVIELPYIEKINCSF